MAAPFADFAIPPLLHLGFLIAGSAVLAAVLYAVQPPLTQRTVLAMVPWVVTGAVLHVFYQVGEILGAAVYPAWAEPLFAAPAVYLTIFLAMGTTWLVATAIGVQSAVVTRDRVASYLAGAGFGIMLPILVLYGYQATDPAFHPLEIVLPVAGLLLSLALAFVVGASDAVVVGLAGVGVGLLLVLPLVGERVSTLVPGDRRACRAALELLLREDEPHVESESLEVPLRHADGHERRVRWLLSHPVVQHRPLPRLRHGLGVGVGLLHESHVRGQRRATGLRARRPQRAGTRGATGRTDG
jgi:hypothetical protein